MVGDKYTIFSLDLGDADIDEGAQRKAAAERAAIEEIARTRRDDEFRKKVDKATFRELLDELFDLPLMDDRWTDEEEWRFNVLKNEMYTRMGEPS
jgi:hypothetical protein